MLTASFDVDFAIEYGVQEAILVNKFLYLERYTTREDGYCWRTAQELYEETGLTKRQTARAIEHLESLGFLETKNTHINGTSINARHFKLTAMFHEKFESNKMLHSGSDKTSLSGSDKKVLSSINNNTVNKQTIEEVRDAWNTLPSPVPHINPIKLNSQRYKSLNERIKEYGVEEIKRAIEQVRISDFLKGNNVNGWMITFDWFIKPNNLPKVLEGNYSNHTGKKKNQFNEFDQREYEESQLSDIEKAMGGF